MAFTYACSDYPGMTPCLGWFTTKTEDELWKHIEIHTLVVHGEDPTEWSDDERSTIQALITSA